MKKKYIWLLVVIALLILIPVLLYLQAVGSEREIPDHMEVVAENDVYMILKDKNSDENYFLRATQHTYRKWKYTYGTNSPRMAMGPYKISFDSFAEMKDWLLSGKMDSTQFYWLYRNGEQNAYDDTYIISPGSMREVVAPAGFERTELLFYGRYISYAYYNPESKKHLSVSVCDKSTYESYSAWLDMDYYGQEGRVIVRQGVLDDYKDADYVYYLDDGQYRMRVFYSYELPDRKIQVIEDRGEGLYILVEQDEGCLVGYSYDMDQPDEALIHDIGFAP